MFLSIPSPPLCRRGCSTSVSATMWCHIFVPVAAGTVLTRPLPQMSGHLPTMARASVSGLLLAIGTSLAGHTISLQMIWRYRLCEGKGFCLITNPPRSGRAGLSPQHRLPLPTQASSLTVARLLKPSHFSFTSCTSYPPQTSLWPQSQQAGTL